MTEITEIESNYWSTQKVEQLLFRMEEEGLDYKSVDNPFHDGDPELKRSNLLYEYTPEEILEIEKCAKDVVYFAKYCRVMTDDGLLIATDWLSDCFPHQVPALLGVHSLGG